MLPSSLLSASHGCSTFDNAASVILIVSGNSPTEKRYKNNFTVFFYGRVKIHGRVHQRFPTHAPRTPTTPQIHLTYILVHIQIHSSTSESTEFLLAYFLDVLSRYLLSVCAPVYPINFKCQNQSLRNLVYIYQGISAHANGAFYESFQITLCVCMYMSLGNCSVKKNVTVAKNTQATTAEL